MKALADLKALAAACREAGITHFEGSVPGWDSDRPPVKFVLGAAPVAPAVEAKKPARPTTPTKSPAEQREDDLDRAVGLHVAIHGGGGLT